VKVKRLIHLAFRSAVAALTFLGVSAFAAAFVGAAHGSIPPTAGIAALLIGLATAAVAFRAAAPDGPDGKAGAWDLAALIAFAVVALRHFGFVLYERAGSYWTSDPFNYGDLPLHWTYVANFARGARFWPENPIFTGTRLQYPFGIDLFTALLVRLGLPLAGTLRFMGLACASLLLFWLWRWGRGFAVAAFLFSGGIGTVGLLGDLGRDAAWKNLFLALFVPQRGFLFALPAGLLLLWSWRERLLRGSRGLPAWVEGILWGVMPLFHLHTFLFLTVVFVAWSAAARRWAATWPPLVWAVLPGTWGVLEVTNGFRAASMVWWKPGWVMAEAHEPLTFLLLNFTLFLPLFLVATVRAVRIRDKEGVSTLVLGLALWIVLFFVMLAPWDWDNTKVMVWCYLLVLPAAGRLVLEPLPRWAAALVVAGLIAPGVPAPFESLGPRNAYQVGQVAEIKGVCDAVKDLPVGARVATAQTFNHPVALCGQPIVAGYAGHLWSHGIKAAAVEKSLRALMLAEPGWEGRARSLSARYLFWGPREAADFAPSSRPWEETRRRVASGTWGRLYDLTSPPDSGPP
jgi:hypothetical protein